MAYPLAVCKSLFSCLITGYYRVNYDEENWKMIIKALNEDHTKIHVINRAQVEYFFSKLFFSFLKTRLINNLFINRTSYFLAY